ncbi:pilus assembly protein [Rhodobacterales bacterium HKCCE3408]|nr:pilus assembly protein [Rhodobacterales bacterium HKCCE3408]
MKLRRLLQRFLRNDRGGAMVEFGMILPLMLVFMAIVIDGGRLGMIYQNATYGVRDATRMLARISPSDICPGGSVAGFTGLATEIVSESITGGNAFPAFTQVISVEPSFRCVAGGFNNNDGTAAVVEVSAVIEMQYLLGGVFGLFGTSLSTLTTTISDQSRIYGL